MYSIHQALVAQMVKRWNYDWKVAGSNPELEGPYGTIIILPALCAVPVFQKKYKTEAPSSLPKGAGSLS